MRLNRFVAGGILAATLALASAAQADQMFLKVTGQKSAQIKGGVTQIPHQGQIKVLDYGTEVDSPRDPQSGLPTGKRMHKPVAFVAELDQSAPLLFNALVNNESLSDVSFEIWATDPRTGALTKSMTVQLVNASVASFSIGMEEGGAPAGPKAGGSNSVEEVSFTYQRVVITYSDGNVVGMDDWGAPLKTLPARTIIRQPIRTTPLIPPKP